MTTNLFLDLGVLLVFCFLSLFAYIRVHSWLRLFLRQNLTERQIDRYVASQ
jgi:hypothetical protein